MSFGKEMFSGRETSSWKGSSLRKGYSLTEGRSCYTTPEKKALVACKPLSTLILLVESRMANPAMINMYKSIQNYTYLHCDNLTVYLPDSLRPILPSPKDRLLSFDATLHRLKFPSSDRYMPRVS